MIGAVLDTNVLASRIAGEALPTSSPGELFRRWLVNRFELVLSEHILAELQRTLAKPYYRARLTSTQVDRALASLRTYGRIVPVTAQGVGVATHPEDDLVLATAVSVGAEYRVTGDRALQPMGRYRGVTILSPRASSPYSTSTTRAHPRDAPPPRHRSAPRHRSHCVGTDILARLRPDEAHAHDAPAPNWCRGHPPFSPNPPD